jgi:hypothetical protein
VNRASRYSAWTCDTCDFREDGTPPRAASLSLAAQLYFERTAQEWDGLQPFYSLAKAQMVYQRLEAKHETLINIASMFQRVLPHKSKAEITWEVVDPTMKEILSTLRGEEFDRQWDEGQFEYHHTSDFSDNEDEEEEEGGRGGGEQNCVCS